MARNAYDWDNDVLTFSNAAGKAELAGADLRTEDTTFWVRYGVKQWLGSYMAREKAGNPTAMLATVREAFDRAKRGEFYKRAGADGLPTIRRAYEIIAESLGRSIEQAGVWFEEYSEADASRREEIRNKPHMKRAIATARLEKGLEAMPGEDFDPNAE